MQASQFTYAGLLLAAIAAPLALSFDKKVQFYTKWKYLFPAILLTALVFVFWDARFTQIGIWHFNSQFTLGINYLGMPIEEWLFFIVIPYCSLFVYEVVKTYLPNFGAGNFWAAVSLALTLAFGIICYLFHQQAYTFFNFLFLTVYLGYTIFRNRFKHHLGHFYLAFALCLIPMLVINGILTALPVVQYHPDHIMGWRIFEMPVEDLGYFFLLLLMNTTIYEILYERRLF